jgi:hypothetical protein
MQSIHVTIGCTHPAIVDAGIVSGLVPCDTILRMVPMELRRNFYTCIATKPSLFRVSAWYATDPIAEQRTFWPFPHILTTASLIYPHATLGYDYASLPTFMPATRHGCISLPDDLLISALRVAVVTIPCQCDILPMVPGTTRWAWEICVETLPEPGGPGLATMKIVLHGMLPGPVQTRTIAALYSRYICYSGPMARVSQRSSRAVYAWE